MNKEITSLTGLRGAAAICVVFLHYFKRSKSDSIILEGLNLIRINGYVAVDIFFLLSSFVMCLAYSKYFSQDIDINLYKKYMGKRFLRIYPNFLFWTLMYLNFYFISLEFPLKRIIPNLFLVQNFFYETNISAVFWSLSSEWILYLIFPFLFWILVKVRSLLLNILLILSSLYLIYLLPSMDNYIIDLNKGIVLLPEINVEVTQGFNSILRCFLSYIIGMFLWGQYNI